MPEQQHSLYSQNLKTSSKTYFFDVKAAKNGSKYLAITEARIKDGQKFRSTITVFQDNLKDFTQSLAETAEKTE